MPRPISYAVFCLKKKSCAARSRGDSTPPTARSCRSRRLPPPASRGYLAPINATSTTRTSTLSLHDALPISCDPRQQEPYDQYHENSHAKHWDYHKTPLIGRQPT